MRWYTITSIRCATSSWLASSPAVAASSTLVRRQQLVLIENEQLQAENIRNQYEVLKNQLNPHMLFNSLNTLRSLVRENQDKAQDYIQELSRVLRYTLQSNESQSVSLREEMEFASAYIFLLKMRFENNLQFDIQIAKSFEDYRLPPMAVQVLIENAVKHNEISDLKPLTIHIVTNNEGYLSVSNDIQPKRTAASGTGIGPCQSRQTLPAIIQTGHTNHRGQRVFRLHSSY